MYLEVLVLFREIKTSKVKLQTKKGIGSCWLHSSLIVSAYLLQLILPSRHVPKKQGLAELGKAKSSLFSSTGLANSVIGYFLLGLHLILCNRLSQRIDLSRFRRKRQFCVLVTSEI